MGGKMKEEKYKGLSSKEVEELTNQGKINVSNNNNLKSNWQIVKDNVCTLFNLYNLIIAIALLAVGAYTNTFFFLIYITYIKSQILPLSYYIIFLNN